MVKIVRLCDFHHTRHRVACGQAFTSSLPLGRGWTPCSAWWAAVLQVNWTGMEVCARAQRWAIGSGGGVEETGAEGVMGCQLQGDVLGNVGLKALPTVALQTHVWRVTYYTVLLGWLSETPFVRCWENCCILDVDRLCQSLEPWLPVFFNSQNRFFNEYSNFLASFFMRLLIFRYILNLGGLKKMTVVVKNGH